MKGVRKVIQKVIIITPKSIVLRHDLKGSYEVEAAAAAVLAAAAVVALSSLHVNWNGSALSAVAASVT